MFTPLIPFMEIESGGYVIKNNKDKKDETEEFIYLEYNNKIFKLQVILWPFSVDKAIDEYIKRIPSGKIELMSDRKIKKNYRVNISKAGKFRLKNKLIKTDNSLCLKTSYLLSTLKEKEKNRTITSKDLDFLFNSVNGWDDDLSISDKDQIINILFEHVNIKLVDEYIIDKQIFSYIINNIDKILNNSDNKSEVINELENILSSSEDNSEIISYLEIQDKFNSALDFYQAYYKKDKQKQKVK